MKVKFKKVHSDVKSPTKAHSTDAGWDLTCYVIDEDPKRGIITYHTGVCVKLPKNHFALLCPRSSVYKHKLQLANGLGVIDENYTGELIFKYRILHPNTTRYEVGDRIGQIVILPRPDFEFEEVDELEESDRGEGGFGSSGR